MKLNNLYLSLNFRVIVLILVVFLPSFLSYLYLSSVFISIAFLILFFGNKQFNFKVVIWPLVLYAIIGMLGMFGNEYWDILRDIALSLSSISLIYIGFWLAEHPRFIGSGLKFLVLYSIFFALNHLSNFLIDPSLLDANFIEIKTNVGGSSYPVIIVIIIGLTWNRILNSKFLNNKYLGYLVVAILVCSMLLTYSRSGLIFVLLSLIATTNVFVKIKFKSLIYYLVFIMFFIILIDNISDNESKTYLNQISRILTEIAISNQDEWVDINSNWRGFEAYRAILSYSNGNFIQILFGQGFGALVDLGFYIKLGGDVEYRYIGIIHNGYVYVLLKTGLVGLFCYLIFYIKFIKISLVNFNSNDSHLKFQSRVLLGLIIGMIFTMFVVGGVAEGHGPEVTLVVGFLTRKIISIKKFEQLNFRGSALPSL